MFAVGQSGVPRAVAQKPSGGAEAHQAAVRDDRRLRWCGNLCTFVRINIRASHRIPTMSSRLCNQALTNLPGALCLHVIGSHAWRCTAGREVLVRSEFTLDKVRKRLSPPWCGCQQHASRLHQAV